jgi:RimJ/RimL family protein N-acetyltransferase
MAILLNGKHIGNIGCPEIDYENENLEVGYWIGKPYWGKGYATEALKLFLKEVKKKFNPVRIVAYHFTYNPASGRVMQKCGFKHEGTRRKVKKKNGKYFDDEMYSLILRNN